MEWNFNTRCQVLLTKAQPTKTIQALDSVQPMQQGNTRFYSSAFAFNLISKKTEEQRAWKKLNYVDWFRHSSPILMPIGVKTFVILIPVRGGWMLPHFSSIISWSRLIGFQEFRLVLVQGARPQISRILSNRHLPRPVSRTIIEWRHKINCWTLSKLLPLGACSAWAQVVHGFQIRQCDGDSI